MPKLGIQPLRRKELIDAAIDAIGERGSLDVTMSEIATRAGVSSALAHHYFGAKDQLLTATMRHLLTELIGEMRAALRQATTPRERISAILTVNFSVSQFRPETVSAWLAFYVEAQRSPPLRRLFHVYIRRLHTNLLSGLTPLAGDRASYMAEAVAAMIDGFYIRRALHEGLPDPAGVVRIIESWVDSMLATVHRP